MAGTEDTLTVRETVLLVVAAAGGRVEGRTAAQKLCYFGGDAIDHDLGHRAHYFGPFSRPVEDALNNSAFAGDIEETVRLFDTGRADSKRAYRYELTEQGKQMVAQLQQDHPTAASRIAAVVGQLGELVPGYSQRPLSLAAKVDLIVRQQGAAIPPADIPAMAKGFGWDVSDKDVEQAVEILVGLDRVQTA